MRQDSRKSSKIALGGLSCALCVMLMFMTGLIPFAEYALPAFAGLILLAVQSENGTRGALLVYAAVSILSIFLVPIKEAALLFIFFFGYYPVLRVHLQRIRHRLPRLLLKMVIFNIAVVCAYWIIIHVFGITEILDEFGPFGKYSVLALLAMGNVFFWIYDYAVGNLTVVYECWFRPKILRRK